MAYLKEFATLITEKVIINLKAHITREFKRLRNFIFILDTWILRENPEFNDI